ncbi:MAG TPA: sugar transferase [Candidatus Microbacterium pullistercoris]|nr:sugar transferase [Candidatus Microbacterium pullistercoris]
MSRYVAEPGAGRHSAASNRSETLAEVTNPAYAARRRRPLKSLGTGARRGREKIFRIRCIRTDRGCSFSITASPGLARGAAAAGRHPTADVRAERREADAHHSRERGMTALVSDVRADQEAAKRALDIVVALCGLTIVAFLLPIIALAITLDSPGPVLFRQQRLGRDGRPFRIVKFRSMFLDAEDELAALVSANQADGPLFKLHRDPRVTRVGRFLRRYSIDELPQFWNVLVGDMSVVGPRPPLPVEAQTYDGIVVRRLAVKPGITGPWQVSGRSDLSWEQSVHLDLHYVDNWSIQTDVIYIARTVAVIVSPKGAY